MPYEFAEYPVEPEPQPASSRGIRPPRKRIGVAVLDEPEFITPWIDRRVRIRVPVWFGVLFVIGSLVILFLLGRP